MSLPDYDAELLRYDDEMQFLNVEAEDLFKENADNYQAVAQDKLEKLNDNVEMKLGLHESLVEYINNRQNLHDRIDALEADLVKLASDKEHAENEGVLLRKKLQNVKEALKKENEEKEDFIKSTEVKRRKIQERNQAVKETISLSQKYLGLEIRTLKDKRIQFLFHDSVESNPELTTFVILQLLDRKYNVLDTEPEVENLSSLTDTLNQTNNLAGFIQHIRSLLIEEATKFT